MIRSLVLLTCTLAAASAADVMGTWKLNTAKSKYVGMPTPKEQTVTYTAKGAGYEYAARGTAADGKPIDSTFTYTKDGEEAKTTGFPHWDGIVLKNGATAKSTAQLKRGGKVVGTASRVVSADGKTMTINGSVTLADGKKATYTAIYDKQ